MPSEEKMTINEHRKYLRLTKKPYLKGNEFQRGSLLDEMEAITALHRKSLIRLPPKCSAQVNRVPRYVPVTRIPWDEREPGHFGVDAVDHCGISSSAPFVQTIQRIDVATGWSQQVSTLGPSQTFMLHRYTHILARFAVRVLPIDPDEASDFINSHLVRFSSTDHLLTSSLPLKHEFRALAERAGSCGVFFT